jgi:hypothetical protein
MLRMREIVFALGASLAVAIAGFAQPPQQPQPLKAVPYSAIEVEESNLTLADGNHMARIVKTRVYKDGEGRTRKDILLDTGEPERIGQITIYDPDTATTWYLYPNDHTARKQVVEKPPVPVDASENKPQLSRRPPADVEAMKPDIRSEPLGEKTIDGYRVLGSRTIINHPAGAFGFERPVVETWESWTSPALHATLESMRDDPRTGKITTRLTEISSDNPPPSLFQISSEYTVVEDTVTHVYPGPPKAN